MWRRIATILAALGLLAAACGGGGAHPDVTAPRDAASIAAGAELYQVHCSRCHGDDLLGGDEGPNLVTSELSHPDEDFVEAITNGLDDGEMPAFATKMTAAEILSVVDFVRTMQAGALEE